MQDIGFAAPLLDLCKKLNIKHLYNLPIHLVEWQVPYPINVAYPVIQYGSVTQRMEGCLLVQHGGQCTLSLDNGETHTLSNVQEVATVFKMGPRPLFSRSGVAVAVQGGTRVGMLVARKQGDEEEEMHALHRLCTPQRFTYLLRYGENEEEEEVDQSWVEKHVLAIGTRVHIQMWGETMKEFYKHIPWKNAAQRVSLEELEAKQVYVMGVLSPPRTVAESCTNKGVWVSIEVRHTMHGSLKNVPFTDMITLCLPPQTLVLLDKEQQMGSGGSRPSKKSKRQKQQEGSEEESSSSSGPLCFQYLSAEASR